MIQISGKTLILLREACREIGESKVTVATEAGVISFDFGNPGQLRSERLGYESQPSRQQLSAIFGIPSA